MARDIPYKTFVDAMDFGTLEWTEDVVKRYIDIEPFHLNNSGVVHGGVILSLMDSASGRCGQYAPPGTPKVSSMTVTLNTSFVGQTRGGRLVATARKVSSGRSLYFTAVEVHNDAGELVATASGVHRWRAGHGPGAKKGAADQPAPTSESSAKD